MAAQFGLAGVPEGASLADIYEFTQGKTDSRNKDIVAYFQGRFVGCQPGWQTKIADIGWHRIWSLNVDDVMEASFQAKGVDRFGRSGRPLSWTEPFRDVDIGASEVQIVHLHGFARDVEVQEDLVFSVSDYLRAATESAHAWHRVFGDIFVERPFVVLGATLAHEYDLAAACRRGNQAAGLLGMPSMLVMPEVDGLNKERFSGFGLEVVETTAEQFVTELIKAVEIELIQIAGTLPQPAGGIPPREARVFLNQFDELNLDAPLRSPMNHDLYRGDDPDWSDALQGKILALSGVEELITGIDRSSAQDGLGPKQAVYFLHAPAGYGKSCALFAVARALSSRGKRTFLYRSESRPSADAILWWIARDKNTVLLFDGVADYARDVAALCESAYLAGVPLLVIATERDSRQAPLLSSLDNRFLPQEAEYRGRALTDEDIEQVITKLSVWRRLGRLTRARHPERVAYFQQTGRRDLFASMAGLEDARGFVDRVDREYSDIGHQSNLQRVYSVACMTYALGYSCPPGVMEVATGVAARDVQKAVQPGGALAGIVRTDKVGFRPRHRLIASRVVERAMPPKERFELSVALASALSLRVTALSITLGTRPYQIARELMDEQVVLGWAGREYAQDWYRRLAGDWGWNSRFWEQRALLEVHVDSANFPQGRSYAEEAVRVHRDPFSLNTLGTILLRMAYQYHSPESSAGQIVLWEGIEALKESRRDGRGENEHPYMSFFSHVLNCANQQPNIKNAMLVREWSDWAAQARQSELANNARFVQQVRARDQDWDRLPTVI